MFKFLKISLFVILVTVGCYAQNSKTSEFIPIGYVEFAKYFSDLNKDGQKDCVLIIKKVDKNNIVLNQFDKKVDRNRRGIIVLFKKGKKYQVADKNYDCFSSENEDGGIYYPPELWIDFHKGNLLIHFAHGRYGFWRYTFRFQDSNFKLIGYDSSSNRGPIVNRETSINFLSKQKLIKENTNENAIGGDETFKENWSNIDIEHLIKLSEIKDFDELNMYNY